jgi:dGTPase
LSKADLLPVARLTVEILKNFTRQLIIMSPIIKVAAFRGKEIVRTLFKELSSAEGHELLPDDFRSWFRYFNGNKAQQMRVVCDFIAGMTDQYAVEFYSRLKSEDPATIFRPI